MNRLPFKTIIFSRVPCKIFGIMPYEILEDILIGLADNNERVLENLSVHAGCFKQPKVIELMFLLADHWCQDSTTKYQAVELLDRFMILYIKQLYKSSTENRNVMDITEAWASAKASLCEKFILYLVSCIQITSKMNFHDHIFNSNVVIQLLRAAGYSYKKEDLLKSEMTVLKTLDFYINIQSPFTFVEMLLEVLGYNGCSLPLKHIHDMCVMVLDLVYLLRNPIYHTLLKSTVDLSTPSSTQRSKFLAVKEDLMLLGTGVIAASTFIINQNSWKQVLEHLSNITGITENSIFEICSAILKHSTGFNVLTTQ
ncbi:PREDICTED: cyclin N-terminal domain-containing protein 1 [Nanorana parkeri]|uniref:cyclin N-terminal domain-containing protein 1 n=1 Tax=Nanorana parkeri TaxID=125878 RepID=UPI000854898E|nr:PREDICTED: cyclin N-terminal domain-containing protein 1 [Nanorana parkeri]